MFLGCRQHDDDDAEVDAYYQACAESDSTTRLVLVVYDVYLLGRRECLCNQSYPPRLLLQQQLLQCLMGLRRAAAYYLTELTFDYYLMYDVNLQHFEQIYAIIAITGLLGGQHVY